MTTITTRIDSAAVTTRTSRLRQMLAGAAVFDAAGGVFCLAVASDLARWLSIPRAAAYVTGAIFLVAAATGGLSLRREPLRVGWIVGTNEVFALWCVLMLAVDGPNSLGVALLAVAALSSAGTGAAELALARRS
jgi:hypothetical protein